MSKPWFGAKSYGVGISPKSLEGWLSILAYGVSIGATCILGRRFDAPPWMIGLAVLVLTIALFVLAVVKGDHQPWRWRWGGR